MGAYTSRLDKSASFKAGALGQNTYTAARVGNS